MRVLHRFLPLLLQTPPLLQTLLSF